MPKEHCYIIAEAGVNHNGVLDNAFRLVDVAKHSGADAVKFQTYQTEQLVTQDAPKADYQKANTLGSDNQFEMLKSYELSKDDHSKLLEYCNEVAIDFLSTPFDRQSADFLIHDLNINRVKISSGDLTNLPLLLHIARQNCPIILSTGMAYLHEIEKALATISYGYCGMTSTEESLEQFFQAYSTDAARSLLRERVALLHCTTAYPTPYENINLNAMKTLASSFQLPVGLSDHSEGIVIPLAAASREANIIEKHITLDKSMPGPDHKASLDPTELQFMVKGIRQIESALGSGLKRPFACELKNRDAVRKSLVAQQPIAKGELFNPDNLTVKRSGKGIEPECYWDFLGMPSQKNYGVGEVIAS